MMQPFSPDQALEQAVTIAGSQTRIARICGVTQASVWKWLRRKKRLPAEHVLRVEAATGVSRHALRPDIYPKELERA
jgi:DNA-binding transcriptional regulator YdaS (Cro superfamily)